MVLGTGWGGARLARDIDTAKYDITIVSPRNHMVRQRAVAAAVALQRRQRAVAAAAALQSRQHVLLLHTALLQRRWQGLLLVLASVLPPSGAVSALTARSLPRAAAAAGVHAAVGVHLRWHH